MNNESVQVQKLHINRAKLNPFIMLHCILNANLLLNYKYKYIDTYASGGVSSIYI